MKKIILVVFLTLFNNFLLSCDTEIRPLAKDKLHLYLLIGQSNMVGLAPLKKNDFTTIERVWLLDNDNTWEKASNPLNKHSSIKRKRSRPKLNPGYTFAKKISSSNKNIHIGLIVNARGATRIEAWQKGGIFYEEAIKRTKIAQKTGILKGILWHQGEGNRNDKHYVMKLSKLIKNFRQELEIPTLPFIVGGIHNKKKFNSRLSSLPKKVPYTGYVNVDDLNTSDKWHFDNESMKILGTRYADEILKVQNLIR